MRKERFSFALLLTEVSFDFLKKNMKMEIEE